MHINEALFAWDPREGSIALFNNGRLPLEQYTESFWDVGIQRCRIIKDVFYAYLRAGATLVLNRLETKSPIIGQLALEIARFVGEKAVANGYAAFGGEGTFAKHWDTHDVFAVQLIGRKHWKVFAPTFELPLTHQKSKERKHECPTEPVFDGILEAGDVLYLPRGWWHEAIPLDQEETFHIAVGIHTTHIVDYIAWACAQVLTQQLAFRQTLRCNQDHQSAIRAALACMPDILLDPQTLRAFQETSRENERVVSAFAIEQFSREGMQPGFGDKTLALNTHRWTTESAHLVANGLSLRLDASSAQIVEQLLQGDGMSIGNTLEKMHPLLREKVQGLVQDLVKHDIAMLL